LSHQFALVSLSFASLLLHEGRSVIYVARQFGHSATLTMSTCGHVIDEFEEAGQVSAEDAILAVHRGERPECVAAE
jgi:hypothetical protein